MINQQRMNSKDKKDQLKKDSQLRNLIYWRNQELIWIKYNKCTDNIWNWSQIWSWPIKKKSECYYTQNRF